MTWRIVPIFIVLLNIISCSKLNDRETLNIESNSISNFDKDKVNNQDDLLNNDYGLDLFKNLTNDEREFVYKITDRKHIKYDMGLFVVLLGNKNIICKVNSINKEYSGNSKQGELRSIDAEADYNIIFINVKDRTNRTIITDKYFNLKLLPVVYKKTREISYNGGDTISTSWDRCFILQIINAKISRDNIYKLIYIDNTDNNITQKEYEYKSSKYPDYIDITITHRYFIVEHDEIEGEEFILINQETGEYEVIDREDREGH